MAVSPTWSARYGRHGGLIWPLVRHADDSVQRAYGQAIPVLVYDSQVARHHGLRALDHLAQVLCREVDIGADRVAARPCGGVCLCFGRPDLKIHPCAPRSVPSALRLWIVPVMLDAVLPMP